MKPPKTMQPEAVKDLEKAGRSKTKSFEQDSFRNYMARKISLQRQQFGLVVPPPPSTLPAIPTTIQSPDACNHSNGNKRNGSGSPAVAVAVATTTAIATTTATSPHHRVRFSLENELHSTTDASSFSLSQRQSLEGKSNHKKDDNEPRRKQEMDGGEGGGGFGIATVLAHLKKRKWCDFGVRRRSQKMSSKQKQQRQEQYEPPTTPRLSLEKEQDHSFSSFSINQPKPKITSPIRTDLFFTGIVVMVNGDTNPDAETLQRLLHRHGGDLEKYETCRVTHIVAHNLSFAKAKMYKQQRKPRPVIYPSWIVDCVRQQHLLPTNDYVLQEFRKEQDATTQKSVQSFFRKQQQQQQPSNPKDEFTASRSSVDTASYGSYSSPLHATHSLEGDLQDTTPPFGTEFELFTQPEEFLHDQRTPSTTNSAAARSLDDDSDELQKRETTFPNNTSRENSGLASLLDNENLNRISPLYKEKVMGSTVNAIASPEAETYQFKENASALKDSGNGTSARTDDKYIHGKLRTVGTDPDFLPSFFRNSRLSYIGSFKQRCVDRPRGLFPTQKNKLDGKRFVFLVDLDCFFAAVVLRNFPQYRNSPVAISHHGQSANHPGVEILKDSLKNSTSECATCNYRAREFGVKKGMYLGRAKELCPELIVLSYDFDGYKEVSALVSDILFRVSNDYGGVVEEVSCDESYLELRLGSENEAADIAERIRIEIFSATDCTATVGVASNKFLAKLAAEHVKPNRSYVVSDEKQLLKPLQLRDIHGIGHRLEPKLAHEGLVTVEDVWNRGDSCIADLKRILGDQLGKKIWLFCQGKDDRPVQSAERKTMGAECNYGVRFDGPYGVDHMILGLAKEVEARMEAVGVAGTKVTLKVKKRKPGAPPPPKFLGHGSCFNLSKSMDAPRPTRDCSILARIGLQLFLQLNIPKDDVRGMGLVVSNLTEHMATDGEGIRKYFQTPVSVSVSPNPPPADNNNNNNGNSQPGQVTIEDHPPTAAADRTSDVAVAVAVAVVHDNPRVPRELTVDDEDDDSSIEIVGVADAFDIDLPSLTQIHMSQVEQLPSSMRNEINRRMQQQEKLRSKAAKLNQPKRLQPAVDDMFRLAAIKAGKETALGMKETNFSASQLEHFPLDIQLELAKGTNNAFNNRLAAARPKPAKEHKPKALIAKDDKTLLCAPARFVRTLPVDNNDFFHENILPMSLFLDENSPGADSLELVTAFFDQLVEASSLVDVCTLLRTIKNRGDSWSADPFRSILDRVNSKVIQSTGIGLDLDI